MAHNFLAPERDQLYLLPPSMADWLDEDHLAFFILDAVDEMNLSAFVASYRTDGRGGAAHHPTAMVALLLYAYCVGVRSSRQIERACRVDVAFRVICAGLFPDHTTIARFRQRHEEALKTLFGASLRLCARAGMVTVGVVAVDGTKMAAAASMAANRTQAIIDAEVEAMFAEAAAVDAAEDAEFGSARGDESPACLRGRADRRRRFAEAKAALDAELDAERAAHEAHLAARAEEETKRGKKLRGRKPKAPQDRAGHKERKVNTTDPDSKVMSTAGDEAFPWIEVALPENLAAQFDAHTGPPLDFPNPDLRSFFSGAPVWVSTVAHPDQIHLQVGASTFSIDYEGRTLTEPVFTYVDVDGSGLLPAATRQVLHPQAEDTEETVLVGPYSIGRLAADPGPAAPVPLALASETFGAGNHGIVYTFLGRDGRLISLLDDGTLVWFDPDTGARLASRDLGTGSARSAVAGPDPGTLAIASERGITLTSADGAGPLTIAVPRTPVQSQLSLSHNGRFVVLAGGGATAVPHSVHERRADQRGYRPRTDFPIAEAVWAGAVPTHPSGDRLLVASSTGQSQLYDTETWALVDEEALAEHDIALGYWNDDGSLLATASSTWQITVRHGDTFEPIRDMVVGTFSGAIGGGNRTPLLFSPDDTLLLTDHDNVARLWDVATGQQIGIDMPTADGTNSSINTGDALQLITGTDDGALIWNLDTQSWADVACRTAGSNLTQAEWEQWGPRDEDHRAICDRFPLET